MAREVLCNLWDAHIDAGKVDIAGLVRISSDNILTFRDYGKGIAPENMGAVYGTYGASTKKNDSKSTGGFGLGCKSPFAYTDSFRVTSYHNGTMTVYNITKSSVESGGKPGITEIMSAPTTETGLEVNIPINPDDVYEILTYIRYVTLHGEMNIELKVEGYYANSSRPLLGKLGMSTQPGSYSYNSHVWYDEYMGDHTVFLRYGGVMYPALDTPATRPALETIKRFMRIIGVDRIVVQAAPDTLALTPSREALSSQKMTENGVVDLCLKLTERVEKDIRTAIPAAAKNVAEAIARRGYIHLDPTSWLDWVNSMPHLYTRYINSSLGHSIKNHYAGMMKNAEMEACRKMFKGNPFCKQILNAIHKAKSSKSHQPYRRLFWQFATKPLVKVMEQPGLHVSSLRSLVWEPYRNLRARNHHVYHNDMDLRAMVAVFSKPVVFITTRLKDVRESCAGWPGFEGLGNNHNYYVYHIGKKKNDGDVERATFSAVGWEVVDLTLNHEWDPVVRTKKIRAAKAKPSKPKVANGLIPLRNICKTSKKGMEFNRYQVADKSEWVGETDKPIFYVEYDDVKYNKLGRYCTPAMLTDEMLDNAVIVRTGVERNMAVKRGAVPVDQYFFGPMLEIYLSKDMKEYLTRQRNPDLSKVHTINSPVLRLMETLGIKVPGLQKLTYRQDLEQVLDAIDPDEFYALFVDGVITESEYDQAEAVSNYKLQEFSWIKQLKSVTQDFVIDTIGIDEIRDLLASNPERKAAFRSLVLIAMKNGIKK
jgi:hypothetical protein